MQVGGKEKFAEGANTKDALFGILIPRDALWYRDMAFCYRERGFSFSVLLPRELGWSREWCNQNYYSYLAVDIQLRTQKQKKEFLHMISRKQRKLNAIFSSSAWGTELLLKSAQNVQDCEGTFQPSLTQVSLEVFCWVQWNVLLNKCV